MFKNNSLKIISVLVALVMWVVVVSGQIETVNMTVPVRLVNPTAGNVAVSNTQTVAVAVKGSARAIRDMKYTSVSLTIDASQIPVGNSLRRVLPADFKTPIGVEVIDVLPAEIQITVDRIASKQLRVIPTFIGEAGKGYKVESVVTKPDYVIAEGARSKLKNVSAVSTIPINLSNLDSNTSFNIGFKDEDGVKTITPSQVEVIVSLRKVDIKKTVQNIPVKCSGLKNAFRLKNEPKLTSVTVSGKEDEVEKFLKLQNF